MQLDLFKDPHGILGYDKYLLAFSGGKDSMACLLHLLELGVDKSKIEPHHHLVDGREGSTLMDWPVTESYCKAVATALGLPIYFSWKQGGFEGEMLRDNELTKPICWENPDGTVSVAGGTRGTPSTRMVFPQVSPSLTVRWCSAYLKIDVLTRLVANSPRFRGRRVLVITGERGQESLPKGAKVGEVAPRGRGCYAVHEPDRSDNRADRGKRARHVDHYRPIRDWMEESVWQIIERWGIRAHPCYYMGWGRCSCRACIFGGCNQFMSMKQVDPDGFETLAVYEDTFGKTIKRNMSLRQLVAKGIAYGAITPELAELAMSTNYNLPILLTADEWTLPAGAYGESDGPI